MIACHRHLRFLCACRDSVLHRSYPGDDSKFGNGESWEEDKEKRKHRMQRIADEYNDEVGHLPGRNGDSS